MVTPSLRAVAVRIEYPLIEARFLYTAVRKHERLIVADVETYVVADFVSPVDVRFVAIAVPAGEERALLSGEVWVYRRREAE